MVPCSHTLHSLSLGVWSCSADWTLRDGNYLIFKDAPKIENIKAGLKYIDINVLRRFSAILHCNGISSHFNIRRSLSSDSYINKSTAKHFTNLPWDVCLFVKSEFVYIPEYMKTLQNQILIRVVSFISVSTRHISTMKLLVSFPALWLIS